MLTSKAFRQIATMAFKYIIGRRRTARLLTMVVPNSTKEPSYNLRTKSHAFQIQTPFFCTEWSRQLPANRMCRIWNTLVLSQDSLHDIAEFSNFRINGQIIMGDSNLCSVKCIEAFKKRLSQLFSDSFDNLVLHVSDVDWEVYQRL